MERRNLILKDTLDLNLSPKAFVIPFRIGIEPMKRLLIASFETLFVKSFRQWPTTYVWKGQVDLSKESGLDGKWLRK
jgi:hypothetical protein